jgi:erythromycin esterase-like protein
MWRNTEVLDFVAFLREFNRGRPRRAQAGFYGLDLYSLYSSVDAVIHYLDEVDPQAARRARDAYGCLEHQDREAQHYGRGVRLGLRASCEEQVLQQLLELRRNAAEYLKRNGMDAADELFQAQQNARLVQNAERYYRAMFTGRENTWNLRDAHMADVLDALARHLSTEGRPSRIVVWEHNSHIGDARATEMGRRGDHNVGQLVRQRHGDACVLVGFTTYSGTVTAADDWDGPAQRKRVRPALEGSVEELFHDVRHERFFVRLRERPVAQILEEPCAERAIGVIYRPQTERVSHYFDTRLSRQFDAVFHFDHTRALEPLDATSEWAGSEMPHTYPWGT